MSRMSDLIAGRDPDHQYKRARKLYNGANRDYWQIAAIAYKAVGSKSNGAKKLADAINSSPDNVEDLAMAYRMFIVILQSESVRHKAKELRRKFPYTRFLTVFKFWHDEYMPLEEAVDWLENFEGGNKALAAEIENKHGAPEWERRAQSTYRQAQKMVNDFGAPKALQDAAATFVEAVDMYWSKQYEF